MSEEYGTPRCRIINECQLHLETTLVVLGELPGTKNIKESLHNIYSELTKLSIENTKQIKTPKTNETIYFRYKRG